MHKTILDYLGSRGLLVRVIYFKELGVDEEGKSTDNYDLGVFEGMEPIKKYRLKRELTEGKAIVLGERLRKESMGRVDPLDLLPNLEKFLIDEKLFNGH